MTLNDPTKKREVPATPPGADEGSKSTDVGTELSAYTDYMTRLDLIHALMGGTLAMRDAGTEYLPQEEGESDTKYDARLSRSVLLNMFRRTLQKLTGEVFGVPINVSEDLKDEDVGAMLEDVDLQGNDINTFAKINFHNGLRDGISHILIDSAQLQIKEEGGIRYYLDTSITKVMEGVDGEEIEVAVEGQWHPLTKKVTDDMKMRPYWVNLEAKDIIGWRTVTVGGIITLTQLRIREKVEVPSGEFDVVEVTRIRVLYPGGFEIYQESDDSSDYELIAEGITGMDVIPLITWVAGDLVQPMVADPPLEDLAFLNMQHWQSSSDQRNILHYARLVTYFGKFLDTVEDIDSSGGEPKIKFGPNSLIHSQNEAGDLKVVEHTGKGIESGRQDLEDLKAEMALFGLTQMMPRTGNLTATARAIDSSENDSALEGWALSFQHFLNNAVSTTAALMGKENFEGGVKVNTDYSTWLSDVTLKELREAFKDGLLPREVVIEEFKRRNVIKEEWEFVEIMKMLDDDHRKSVSMQGLAGSMGDAMGAAEEEEMDEE